ncbi:uncharacterized protein LOC120186309 [Hibiscus syriacus]|uniref:uncharacterized protein LOC120186309 n=1 Tax=Hibiscus syriacus TaxID=106335 RepID=UPI001924A704|nr:uncharacterized protein LOC120186309 [Hibiscus syriacus]
MRWGGHLDPACVLCDGMDETRDHLFAECLFSRGVWGMVMQACQERGRRKSLRATVVRVAWCSYLYYIWQERNGRIHGALPRHKEGVTLLIRRAVASRLKGCVKVVSSSLAFAADWDLV